MNLSTLQHIGFIEKKVCNRRKFQLNQKKEEKNVSKNRMQEFEVPKAPISDLVTKTGLKPRRQSDDLKHLKKYSKVSNEESYFDKHSEKETSSFSCNQEDFLSVEFKNDPTTNDVLDLSSGKRDTSIVEIKSEEKSERNNSISLLRR